MRVAKWNESEIQRYELHKSREAAEWERVKAIAEQHRTDAIYEGWWLVPLALWSLAVHGFALYGVCCYLGGRW